MPGRGGQTVRPQRWYDRSDSEPPVQGFIVAGGASSPVRLFGFFGSSSLARAIYSNSFQRWLARTWCAPPRQRPGTGNGLAKPQAGPDSCLYVLAALFTLPSHSKQAAGAVVTRAGGSDLAP